MTIYQAIENAAAACKSGTKNFTFTLYAMEAEELNKREGDTDFLKFPFMHLDFPISGIDEIIPNTNGRIKTTYALRLYFANQTKLENNIEQRLPIVQDMELAKNEFLSALYSNDEVEIIGTPAHSTSIEAIDFDFNTDGIYLNLKARIETTPAC